VVTAAIVGTGFGMRMLLPALRDHAGIQPIAVVGSSSRRARAVIEACGEEIEPWTIDQLRSRCDEVDLIACCVPNADHEAVARALIDIDAALLLEKPLTTRGPGADRALAADLAGRRRPTWIDFPLRHLPCAQRAADMIGERDGRQVDVAIRLETGVLRRYPPAHWKTAPGLGGLEHLILPHVADLVLALAHSTADEPVAGAVELASVRRDEHGRPAHVRARGAIGRVRYRILVVSRAQLGFGERLTVAVRRPGTSRFVHLGEEQAGDRLFDVAIGRLAAAVGATLRDDAGPLAGLAGAGDAVAASGLCRRWLSSSTTRPGRPGKPIAA
jgi:predicted dehydrogenase